MALSALEISALRSQGVSEEEIARRNLGDLPMATFGGNNLPMGVAGYIGKNPIIDPNMVTPATVMSLDENGPTPALVEANPGVYHDVNDPPLPPREPELPQDTRPVVQQQAEQMQAAAMDDGTGIGGPGGPVDNQMQGYDPFGSFAAGFAGSQAPAYSGSLQAIAAAFGGGSAAMQRDMALQRSSLKDTSGMKEYNLAASQGYGGSWMDYKKETSTPLVTIGGGVNAPTMLTPQENTRFGYKPTDNAYWHKGQPTTPDLAKESTPAQQKAMTSYQMGTEAITSMTELLDNGYIPNKIDSIGSSISGEVGSMMMSDEGKQFFNSSNAIRSRVAKEMAGTAMSKTEQALHLDNITIYSGDSDKIRRNKIRRMESYTKGWKREAGKEVRTTEQTAKDLSKKYDTENDNVIDLPSRMK